MKRDDTPTLDDIVFPARPTTDYDGIAEIDPPRNYSITVDFKNSAPGASVSRMHEHVRLKQDPRIHAAHLMHAFQSDRLRLAIDYAAPIVLQAAEEHNFQALVYRGHSGACYAWPMSYATGIGVVMVRKPDERSHGEPVEGMVGDGVNFAFIDDFISSGETYAAVAQAIGAHRIKAALLMQLPLCNGMQQGEDTHPAGIAVPTYYLGLPEECDPYPRCM